MGTLLQLIVSIAPLVFISVLSPVVFINGLTSVNMGGQKGGWAFAAGNALVLGAVGFAFFGVLGSSAASFAERQFASQAVDRFLAIAMFGFAGYLAWAQYASGHPRELSGRPAPHHPSPAAFFGWGVLGQVTNLTTLPFLAAVSQRIGAANLPMVVRLVVLLVTLAVVLVSSWGPVVIATVAPQHANISDATRACISRWMGLASIIALLAGGIVLLAQSW